MATSKMPKLSLPTVDDLFRVGDEHNRDKREWVRDIPIDKICDFNISIRSNGIYSII